MSNENPMGLDGFEFVEFAAGEVIVTIGAEITNGAAEVSANSPSD